MHGSYVPRSYNGALQGESLKPAAPGLDKQRTDQPTEETEMMFAVNEPITKHSARVIRKQILRDGYVSKAERRFLRTVLESGNLLDDEAYHILLNLLLNGKRPD